MVPVISAEVSSPEHHGTCPVVPESLDQATLPSSGATNPSVTVTPVPDFFLRRLDDISTASGDVDLDCFSREPHRRCSHQEHPESCRRHTPELGDVDKDPSTICPYDSGLFNVLRGSVCQMAQHIPCLLPGQRIHISRSPKKSPPRHRRMCPRNQPLVHPVWRKEFNVRPLSYSNILCMMTIFWNGSCFRYLIFIFIIVCH